MKIFRVAEYGLDAWQWSPESLKVFTECKVTGCNCKGTGNIGTVERFAGEGITVKHAIPCVCLRAVIDEENFLAVEDEMNQHFMENKTLKINCPCLFCKVRRKVVAEEQLTGNA